MPDQAPPKPQSTPALSRLPAGVLEAARVAAAGRYEILGELGASPEGEFAFLARRLAGGDLIAIRFRTTHGGAGALDEVRALNASVPSPTLACVRCGHAIVGWERRCSNCGTDVAGAEASGAPDTIVGAIQATIAQMAPAAAGAGYDVLGAMPRAAGGADVYFGRDRANGRLVTMQMQSRLAGGGNETQAIGFTQIGPQVAPTIVGGAVQQQTTLPPPTPSAPAPSWQPPPTPSGDPGPSSGTSGSASADGAKRVCPQCGVEFDANVRFCPTDGSTLILRTPVKGLVGQIVARRYEVRRILGEGGMGQVYLAEQIKMRRLCALKVMRPEQVHDADAAGRFGREAHNASRIMHPHVAAIYDFGETDDGLLYIAMEYVDGVPLSEVLKREGMLAIPRAVDIGRQIAEALAAAHELGIVHRDLKPDNVMLAKSRGGGDVVKVVDFGIAKAVQTEGQQITRTGFIVGTPAYMSPEQITGDPLDGRSDIYALGCILFKMLTGTEPMAGAGGHAVLMRRLAEAAPRARTLNPDIPVALDDVVARALERLPKDRFDSADAFLQALAQAGLTRQPSRAGGVWSALRARLGGSKTPAPSLAAANAGFAPAGMSAPAQHAGAGAAPWRGGSSGGDGGGGVAVGGGQPSPAAPWRVYVDSPGTPSNPAAGQAATGPAAPVPWRPTPRVIMGALVAGFGIVAGIVLVVTHGDSPKKPVSNRPPVTATVDDHAPGTPIATGSVGTGAGEKTPGDSSTPVDASSNADSRAAATRIYQEASRTALQVRENATAAGATKQELARGDGIRRRADAAAATGKYSAASVLVTEASDAWLQAGDAATARFRTATLPPTATTTPPGGNSVGTTPPGTPPATRSADSAVSTGTRPGTGVPVSSVDSTATPRPGGADVRAVIAGFIAAVNTREMAQMRRLWPTMPDDAAHNWQALFNAATDLSVKLVSSDEPTVNGTHAQTNFAYTITGFVPSQGAIPPKTFQFHAKLERDAWGWRIASMDAKK